MPRTVKERFFFVKSLNLHPFEPFDDLTHHGKKMKGGLHQIDSQVNNIYLLLSSLHHHVEFFSSSESSDDGKWKFTSVKLQMPVTL